jgi:hypothetical protein
LTSPPAAAMTHAIEKVRRVPDRHRAFTVSPDQAQQLFRVDLDVLAQALDTGLPSRGRGTDVRLDPLDLRNLAISLGLNTPWSTAMSWWVSALDAARADAIRTCRIGVCSRCRRCTRDSACTVSVSPQLLQAARRVEPAPGARADLYATVRLAGAPEAFPPEVAAVLRSADPIEWHLIPDALITDVGFLRDTGLSDCRLMARHLRDEAHRHGLRTRPAFGLIVTAPFSREHTWVEFDVDGRWLPADPLLFNSMARWGHLDPAWWPPTMSPLGTMWRIGEASVPLVTHDGLDAVCSLPTKTASALGTTG